MIVQGLTSSGISRPLLVDASGRPIVSSYPHQPFTELAAANVATFAQANNGTTTIYTVGAGKTLYLTSIFIAVNNNTGAAATGRARIDDATPANVIDWVFSQGAAMYNAVGLSFVVPIPCPAGYTVKAFSSIANLICTVSITGYLI